MMERTPGAASRGLAEDSCEGRVARGVPRIKATQQEEPRGISGGKSP